MKRLVPIVLVVLVGVALSTAAFLHLRDHALERHLQRVAAEGQKALQRHLLSSYDLLEPLGGLFRASDFVRRDEFAAFTRPILDLHPTIQALEWVPKVKAGEKQDYIARAKRDGLSRFAFKQRGDKGIMLPAEERPIYFPVFYIEPLLGNEKAIGFDLGSSPKRLDALHRAEESGKAVATSRITLVQETKRQFGYLIFQPVYDGMKIPVTAKDKQQSLLGFALGVFKISDFVDRALKEAGGEVPKLDVYLFDVTEKAEGVNIHPRLINDISRKNLDSQACIDTFISHGQRKWLSTFCDSPNNPLDNDDSQAWLVLILGLSLTGLLAVYFRSVQNRQLIVEELIVQRTTELEEANVALTDRNQELRKTDEALRSSEGRIKAIVDNVIDAIVTIDHRGTMKSANSALERVFGYTEDEVIGRNVSMLAPEPIRSEHDSYLANYLRTGIPKIIGASRELNAQRKDGSIFPMELAVSELEFQGERLFIGLIRDITHRKEVEKIKSELVSTVSHELRTPLTSIRGSLGLLAGEAVGDLPDQMKRLVELALKNTDRLVSLVNDILDLEKLASGTMEFEFVDCSLRAVIAGALSEYAGYAEEQNVRFVFKDFEGDCTVMADPQRINQVLANLLSNAAKYSPDGGEVLVSLEGNGDYLRVNIADHGPGIPQEYRESIFDRFSQVDSTDTRKKGGTGLGLNIVKSIVEHHDGHVDFISDTDGSGTVFFFELRCKGADRRSPSRERRKR